MSLRGQGAGLVCGFLLGAFLGWAWGPALLGRPPSLTAAARAMPPSVRLRPQPLPRVAPGEALDADAVIQAQDEQIRALYDLAFGRPLVWPDDETRLAVEDAFHEAISSCAPEVTLLELDCSEPPCLAAFAIDAADDVSDLCPNLPRNGYIGVGESSCPDGRPAPRMQVVKIGNEMTYRDANAFEDLSFGDNAFVRFKTRAKELMSTVSCR